MCPTSPCASLPVSSSASGGPSRRTPRAQLEGRMGPGQGSQDLARSTPTWPTTAAPACSLPRAQPHPSCIENMWRLCKIQVQKTLPTPAEGYWQVLQKCWNNVPQAHVKSLIDSMPRRLQAVIHRCGGRKHYIDEVQGREEQAQAQ